MSKKIELGRNEKIIAVVPEHASGPGWANQPTWIYIHDTVVGKLRTECIQPDERTDELAVLWDLGSRMCAELLAAVPWTKTKE